MFRRVELPAPISGRLLLHSMPVTAIALQLAQRCRHLGDRRFELLQANHIRPLAFDPLENLHLSGADAVHVPGGDF